MAMAIQISISEQVHTQWQRQVQYYGGMLKLLEIAFMWKSS